jgi:adenosylmethionine-8-amino-7-oxononanoate aminotransferase
MLPLAATLVKEELFAAFKTGDRRHLFAHGHSMTGNPIACAVARESLRLTRELEVPEKLDRIGQRIERALAPLRLRRNVANLRRTGGIVAYDLVPERGAQTGYFSELAPKLRAVASELGVLLRPLGNVVYALPPACTSEEQCDKIVAAMEAVAEAGS